MGGRKRDWDGDTSDPSWPRRRRATSGEHRSAWPRRSLWRRFADWWRRLLGRPPVRSALPAPRRPWLDHDAIMSADVRELLARLPDDAPDEVVDLVAQTVEDYAHLAELIERGALSEAPVEAAGLLGGAEATLLDIARRAPNAATVLGIAARRRDDPDARRAADEAVARLRTESQTVHDAASAAIQFAATLASEDAALLEQSAHRLQHLLGEPDGGT